MAVPCLSLLLLLVLGEMSGPLSAVGSARSPRHWFGNKPAALRMDPEPNTVTMLTTTITATRVVKEVHLSSCVILDSSLPACPSGKTNQKPIFRVAGSSSKPVPQSRIESSIPPDSFGAMSKDYLLDPREMEGATTGTDSFQANRRSFSGLQNLLKKILAPESSEENLSGMSTPPLPSGHNVITRTVTITRKALDDIPITSTVSFALSGCIPTEIPLDLENCDVAGVAGRPAPLRTVSPTRGVDMHTISPSGSASPQDNMERHGTAPDIPAENQEVEEPVRLFPTPEGEMVDAHEEEMGSGYHSK